MSGKPQYDEDAVLDAATDVFWRHGYASASIGDLTEATALSRSSLYQRFGDKEGLFNEVLERYIDRVLSRMKSTVTQSSKASVAALLLEFVPKEGNSTLPPGCLLLRCIAEQINLAPAGRTMATTGVRRQHRIFLDILKQGQLAGEIGQSVDLEVLAWYYFGVLQAVVNIPAVGVTSKAIAELIDMAMSAWPSDQRH